MKKKLWPLLGSVLLIILFNVSTGRAVCNLRVGWEPWPPYLFLDEKGNLSGLDKEIISAAARLAHCSLTFKKLPWKRHLIEVKHGRIDIATGANKSPDRMEYAYFSNAYRNEYVALFVRKGESAKYPIRALNALLDMPFMLGVTRGYYYGKAYETVIQNPQFIKQIQEVTNDQQNYHKLIKKRINGFLADRSSAVENIQRLGLKDQIEMHPMPLIPTGEIFLMFSKTSVPLEILQRFNAALSRLKKEGVIDRLSDKYIDQGTHKKTISPLF